MNITSAQWERHEEVVAELNRLVYQIRIAQHEEGNGLQFSPEPRHEHLLHDSLSDEDFCIISISTCTIDALAGTELKVKLGEDGYEVIQNVSGKYGFLDSSGRSPNCGAQLLTADELIEEFKWFLSTRKQDQKPEDLIGPLCGGVGMLEMGRVLANGTTEIREGIAIDGYEIDTTYEDADGNEISIDLNFGAVTSDFVLDAIKKQHNVPADYSYFYHGMNDTDEAGYVIFTNNKWTPEELSYTHDGYITSGGKIFNDCWIHPYRDQ